jgi:hypothetical protein
MKYLKKFESIKNNLIKPQIGDYLYVKVEDDFNLPQKQKEDAKTRIFKILEIKKQFNYLVYKIKAVHEENKKDYDSWFLFEEYIICFAPTIDQLKIKYESQKYNL